MAGLVPFARIVDLESDSILASTTNIIDWSVDFKLDAVGSLMVEVGAADAGDPAGGVGFAAALLQAASDLGSTPRPLLLEFSLDGGASFDSRKVVEQPVRTLKASERTIKEDGADLGSILSTVPCERVTYTDCKLKDVFNGAVGGITPIAGTGITGGTIPYLQGLLTVEAGLPGWAGRARVQWTARVDPVVQNTATNVDVDSATTLAACETIVNRLAGAFVDGDTVPQSYRGHYVADPSDDGLNLGGQANSFVVGNVAASLLDGSTTLPHLTFDATGAYDTTEAFPEDRVARLHLDSAVLKSDDTTLTPACNFVGGKSTAGFPDGAKVTGLTILNGTSATMSSTKDDWRDGVPLIGVNVNDASGGLYFTILDGLIRPVPGSPAAPCQSIAADLGQASPLRHSALFMGTNHGIYYAEGVDLNTGSAAWGLLGDLNANVVRINVEINPSDTTKRVVYALVKGSGERTDGVYRWTDPTSSYSYGTTGWQTVLQNTNVVDMIATDYQQFWAVLSKPQDVLARYAVSAGRGDLQQRYTLPSGGQIQHIQEVVTVAHGTGGGAVPAQDTVWVLCAGAPSPAYYLVNSGDNFASATFKDANSDGTLVGPNGTALQLNRVVGLGISFDGTVAQAFAGSDQGVYFTTAALGGALNWQSANEQGGLANYNIKGIAAPESQNILGRSTNRIYCATEDDLLYSSSSGRWWETIKGRDRTTLGPYLSWLTLAISDANGTGTGQTLPYARVRTWGSVNADDSLMASSPIGAADTTHVRVPDSSGFGPHVVANRDAIPAGYYVERYLDQHLDYQYRLVNQACPFPGLQMAQLPDLQSNASVDAETASKGVMTVMTRWLPMHAVPQTVLSVESSFTDTAAALRSLRPTHLVTVDGTVTITDVSSTGEPVTTRVWDAASAPMYVLSHKIARGPGMTALTTTDLGTQLFEKLPTEADLANSLSDSLQAVKIWR